MTTWVVSAAVSAVWSVGQRRGSVGPTTRVRVWFAGSGGLGPRLMGGGRVGRPWGGAYAPLWASSGRRLARCETPHPRSGAVWAPRGGSGHFLALQISKGAELEARMRSRRRSRTGLGSGVHRTVCGVFRKWGLVRRHPRCRPGCGPPHPGCRPGSRAQHPGCRPGSRARHPGCRVGTRAVDPRHPRCRVPVACTDTGTRGAGSPGCHARHPGCRGPAVAPGEMRWRFTSRAYLERISVEAQVRRRLLSQQRCYWR